MRNTKASAKKFLDHVYTAWSIAGKDYLMDMLVAYAKAVAGPRSKITCNYGGACKCRTMRGVCQARRGDCSEQRVPKKKAPKRTK
jgi:hypothetical protein